VVFAARTIGHGETGVLIMPVTCIDTFEAKPVVDAHKAAASRIPADLMQKAMTLFASPPAGMYYNSEVKRTT
jgi:hypothetical protein